MTTQQPIRVSRVLSLVVLSLVVLSLLVGSSAPRSTYAEDRVKLATVTVHRFLTAYQKHNTAGVLNILRHPYYQDCLRDTHVAQVIPTDELRPWLDARFDANEQLLSPATSIQIGAAKRGRITARIWVVRQANDYQAAPVELRLILTPAADAINSVTFRCPRH